MELAIIGYGLVCFGLGGLIVMTFRRQKIDITVDYSELFEDIRMESLKIRESLKAEGKKTRKDLQEVKTRLTQVRKDLNKIEKKVKK